MTNPIAMQSIENHRQAYIDLAKKIWSKPEVAYQEHEAAEWTAQLLEECGFQVERGACGIPTAPVSYTHLDVYKRQLDVTVQSQVLRLLKKLRDERGVAILLITHNLGIVWEMCDRVMTMYAGKTVEYTTTKELYSNPLHPYTWGLLDSIPSLVEDKGRLNTIEGMPPDLRLTGTCCNFYNRCPYATPLCKEKVPDLVEVTPGHFVACHRQNGKETLKRGEYRGTVQCDSEDSKS